jgi:hypothetical protein
MSILPTQKAFKNPIMAAGTFYYFRIKLSLLILACLLVSCKVKKRPAEILSPAEMVNTMSEIYLSEQKVSKLGLTPDSSKVVFQKIQGKIFENTGVPDSIFKRSFDYYIDRPAELEQIYSALVDSLNLREQRLNVTPSTQERAR